MQSALCPKRRSSRPVGQGSISEKTKHQIHPALRRCRWWLKCWCGIPCAPFCSPVQGLMLSRSLSLSLPLPLASHNPSAARWVALSTCGLLWSTWPCLCVPKVCNLRFAPSAAHPALSAREASLRKQSIKFIQLSDDVVGG